MRQLKCDICGKQFDAAKGRSWGNHCKGCAGWLRALGQGPFQDHPAYERYYNELGAVITLLIREGKLKITG